jgi:hypothetical protein
MAPAAMPPRPPKPDWEPTGPAAATIKHDGLTMRLWLSDTVAEPGDWVQAHVRVTNTGDRTRFHEAPGPCVGLPFEWSVDLFPLFDPGREWPGGAGRLKGELTRWGPVPNWVGRDEDGDDDGVASVTRAFAECMGPMEPGIGRLEPGDSIDDDLAFYPRYMFDRPLPPGPITVGVSFNDWGARRRPDRDHRPLRVEGSVLVTGPDPGYVSPLVLIDRALSVPDFFRYVTASDGQQDWTNAHWLAWPYVPTGHLPGLDQRPVPNGFLGIGLFGTLPGFYEVDLDPWTGELLAAGPR